MWRKLKTYVSITGILFAILFIGEIFNAGVHHSELSVAQIISNVWILNPIWLTITTIVSCVTYTTLVVIWAFRDTT
jgi:heme/copper-type cytochrome/quinol oxidase subunit 2